MNAKRFWMGYGTTPSAFSLLEILIVIAIMSALSVVAVTMLGPTLEDRKVREAARMVNGYLASARNAAMQTGRPCGVMLRAFRNPGSPVPICVMQLDQCQVPPPYCGDIVDSRATVVDNGDGSLTATLSLGDSPVALLRCGDVVQFNYQGHLYPLSATNPVDANGFVTDTAGTWVLACDTLGQLNPWDGQSVPYRIYRSPIKSAAAPLQLPTASVIDLAGSGIDGGASFNVGNNDVVIQFSSNGSVEHVNSDTRHYVTQPIFLLIGKRERVLNTGVVLGPTAADQDRLPNVQDLSNYWVVINPQTGHVTSDVLAVADTTDYDTAINTARSIARDSQGIGGR